MLKDFEDPVGLDFAEAELILSSFQGQRIVCGESGLLRTLIDHFSRYFLGRSYAEGSLGGGPGEQEQFHAHLDAFDCVTFIETVMALSLTQKSGEFVDVLRRIRYEDGKIDW